MSRYREWEISCKVYIGNLGSSASKHEIESAFSKYGPLRNVWVARNPPGFAFVEFEDPRDAEDAVRGLDGTRCCGTKVKVEMSTGRRRHSGGRRPGPRYSSPHFSYFIVLVNMLSEQDLRTIYLFDKLIGPDLAVLVGNLWVVIRDLCQEVQEDHHQLTNIPPVSQERSYLTRSIYLRYHFVKLVLHNRLNNRRRLSNIFRSAQVEEDRTKILPASAPSSSRLPATTTTTTTTTTITTTITTTATATTITTITTITTTATVKKKTNKNIVLQSKLNKKKKKKKNMPACPLTSPNQVHHQSPPVTGLGHTVHVEDL
ncbi:hypothetical protein M0802_012081 [Mischocyttarus mexicanus]|nr:hypothetical protein M0802_012081 [Mischocyttarus mexicanus]